MAAGGLAIAVRDLSDIKQLWHRLHRQLWQAPFKASLPGKSCDGRWFERVPQDWRFCHRSSSKFSWSNTFLINHALQNSNHKGFPESWIPCHTLLHGFRRHPGCMSSFPGPKNAVQSILRRRLSCSGGSLGTSACCWLPKQVISWMISKQLKTPMMGHCKKKAITHQIWKKIVTGCTRYSCEYVRTKFDTTNPVIAGSNFASAVSHVHATAQSKYEMDVATFCPRCEAPMSWMKSNNRMTIRLPGQLSTCQQLYYHRYESSVKKGLQ